MRVNLLIGANAYACIEENGRKTDIKLQAGKSASASLREFAAEQMLRASKAAALADLAERAAATLDGE